MQEKYNQIFGGLAYNDYIINADISLSNRYIPFSRIQFRPFNISYIGKIIKCKSLDDLFEKLNR